MKRTIAFLLAILLLIAALHGSALANVPDAVYEEIDWPIYVDDIRIDTPPPLMTDVGCRQVPVRAIAEALGFVVRWHSDTRTITLDDTISFVIGQNRYEIGDKIIEMECYALTVPQIWKGSAYVPFCFFRDMLEMTESRARDGTIRINSEGGFVASS